MAVQRLVLESIIEDDYELIAIHSALESHRIAFLLNKKLELRLYRTEKDIHITYKGFISNFPLYQYEDDFHHHFYSLFRNKFKISTITKPVSKELLFNTLEETSMNMYVLPELKNVDYLLKIETETTHFSLKLLVSKLLAIPQIITAYAVNSNKLKSKKQPNFRIMPKNKKTKIVATLGPATSTKEVLKKMLDAGVNVFRINFSHAKYEDVKERVQMIRALNKEYSYNAAILADLQGPKLRVGVMKGNIVVNDGDTIDFVTGKSFEGTAEKVYMNYDNFPRDVKAGERVLLDDGKLIFEVVSSNGKDTVKAKVIQGGPLKSKKGVNLPNTAISLPALTEKDIEDAIFACSLEVDWMALSFVRHEEDLMELQALIKEHSEYKIPIIAKIEKPEGVQNIDKIVAYCDGLMVARGDLGVEIPAQEVPLIQKQLVLRAKKARIPVIIATQMMETMIESLTPTRAEVNDVANSVMDGADAVMLSGETSVGKYPVQVIETMTKIISSVEDSELIKVPQNPPHVRTNRFITKSICYHAATMANDIEARAICTLTNSGYTAFQISAWRPTANILVFTSNQRILSQLSLLWGVKAFYYNKYVSTDDTVDDVNKLALERGFVDKGDMLINLAAMPMASKGMVNTLRVSHV